MTETQAKSGTAGASTNPVEGDAAGGASATGRAAVGRAAVPADAPQPKFTRAPGMVPPPEKPGDGDNGSTPDEGSDANGGSSAGASSVPVGASVGAANSGSAAPAPATSGVSASGVSASAGTPPSITRPGVSRPGDSSTRPGDATATAATTRPGAAGSATAASASAVGAARVTEAVRTARSTVAGGASRGPRRARLNVKRIDPWSVFKFSFAVSLVLFIVVIVATSVLYLALDAMGVFEKVNTSLGDLISASGGSEGSTFKITAKGVIGTSALIGVVNVVLFTALATLGAFIYNVCADLVGGVELTLAERD
ncbi:transmembrane protein DUF3566 [Asanoa ferruginea]|uniref:Transmembrane protein DUF3566 n=1 Tax=Asanoa ferruginea TaxID=53367 RepID=A0A3D9ZHN5_9ACTN|nr:DUF3566 domain-containing protein [Asanoa ferruginea]REF96359.1 transmembrane protein DUF3566 [Asanoa ferruginea]